MTEQALPFYGFNGYEADYNLNYEEDTTQADYRTRMYYRHERNTLRLTADFQKSVLSENLRVIAGFGYIDTEVDTVDETVLN
ncbi:hypothetical protein HQ531_14495, partial [bacterium]|nr:hypothetical protein [bacterium]